MANPDRLYIDIKMRDLIDNKMKKFNFLNADNARNKEIFFYALSLGLSAPTHIEGTKDGYILEKDLNPIDEAIIYSCIIPTIKDIDNITNKAQVYDYIQKCANTGFKIISNIIDENSGENIDKKLLLELDDKYALIFGNESGSDPFD